MRNRFKASGIHFLLSLTIVSIVLSYLVFVLYPQPFYELQDLHKVVVTLICVDIVLGPLLTLIVFNPKKKWLKLDLLAIGLVQVMALSYGVYTSYISRPIYVVFSDDRFNSVTANEYTYLDLKKIPSNNPYLQLPITGPKWLGAIRPDNLSKAEKMDLEFSTALGDGLRVMPQYYVPYEEIKPAIKKISKLASTLDLSENNPIFEEKSKESKKGVPTLEQVKALKRWLSSLSIPLSKIGLVPIKGRENYAIIAINIDTVEVIDSVSIDPWWYQ